MSTIKPIVKRLKLIAALFRHTTTICNDAVQTALATTRFVNRNKRSHRELIMPLRMDQRRRERERVILTDETTNEFVYLNDAAFVCRK